MAVPPSPAVVLTREPEDNEVLAHELTQRGIPVVEVPCTATRYLPPEDLPREVDLVIFTSRRGVIGLFGCPKVQDWLESEDGPKLAVVGPATAQELSNRGFEAQLVADPPRGEVLAQQVIDICPRGSRVALVRGNLGVGELDGLLVRAGYDVVALEVYQNVAPNVPGLIAFPVAAVFVAAPSAGRRLLAVNPWLKGAHFVAIGPTTRQALAELGMENVSETGPGIANWIEVLCAAHYRAVQKQG